MSLALSEHNYQNRQIVPKLTLTVVIGIVSLLIASCSAIPPNPSAGDVSSPSLTRTESHETSKTPDSIPPVTPTNAQLSMFYEEIIYYFDPKSNEYGYFEFPNGKIVVDVITSLLQLQNPDSANLVFANHSPRIAFWFGDLPEVWLADLNGENLKLLLQKEELISPYTVIGEPLNLVWTPNDKYLIIDFVDPAIRDQIYSIDHNELSEWPFDCSEHFIATSKISSSFALWCPSSFEGSVNTSFGVIEWNGEVWISEVAPNASDLLTEAIPDNQRLEWAWSPDGQFIAYSDDDLEALVYRVAYLSKFESAQINLNSYKAAEFKPFFTWDLMSWSNSANRLVAYASKTGLHACPIWHTKEPLLPDEQPTYSLYDKVHNVPCWMVLDVESNTIIWTTSHFLDSLEQEIEFLDRSVFTPLSFSRPVFSSDGNFLTVSANTSKYIGTWVIDLSTGEIIWSISDVFWPEMFSINSNYSGPDD